MDFPIFFDGSFQILMIGKGLLALINNGRLSFKTSIGRLHQSGQYTRQQSPLASEHTQRSNLTWLHVISGNYTCEVEWIGSPISITHKLTVLVPPSIVAVLPGGLGQVDHPIEAREGSQVRLECRAEGIPPPIVRWRSPVSHR